MKRLYLDHKLMLVGVAIPGGIYLGPAYFYLSGLFQLVFRFNPAMMGALASLVGVAATVGVYRLGKKLGGNTVAVTAMAVYAFSYLVVIYNRIYWTLTWSSLAALTTYWALHQVITAKKQWPMYLMTVFLILGSQSDGSYFSLMATSVAVLVLQLRSWRPLRKTLAIAAIVFIIAQLPIVLFDLRHNFYNTKLILKLVTSVSGAPTFSMATAAKSVLIFPKTMARLVMIQPPYDVTYQLSPAEAAIAFRQGQIPVSLILLAGFALLTFILKSWKQEDQLLVKIIKTHVLVAVAGVLIYNLIFPGYTHEWFLTILFPAIALILAVMFKMMIRAGWAFLAVPVLAAMLTYNAGALLKTDNAFGFGYKRQAVAYALEQVNGRSFYLNAIGSQAYGGYRYLFWLYGHEPAHSFMDNVYGDWLDPMPGEKETADLGVVMVSLSEFEPEKTEDVAKAKMLREEAVARQKFGGVEVLILPQKSG